MNGGCAWTATPTATAARAPIRNCPCAPMLKRPPLNASPTERPASTSGVVNTRVLTMASKLPTAPLNSAT